MNLRRLTFPLAALGVVLALLGGFTARSSSAATAPGQTEADITRVTTGLLEHSQFSHHPFDEQLAGTLLERYLDALDGSRTLFLQSDVNEFAGWRAGLVDDMRMTGSTRAADAIFARYLERLEQRTDYLTATLKAPAFDFTGHDLYSFDREHAARPPDLAAAKALWSQQLRAAALEQKLLQKTPQELEGTLLRRYTQQLKAMKILRPDEVLEIYLDALAHVYDPHSDYLSRASMESFLIAMNLSLVGIGATLEIADGGCTIHELVPGGPAARSGLLKPGDRIVAVAQAGQEPIELATMTLARAVELIRGPKGTAVTLSVIHAAAPGGSAPAAVTLVRDEIKLEDQEAKARIVELPTGKGATVRLGVIDLPSFYADDAQDRTKHRSATEDVARLLRKLKAEKVLGVVLDLRRNGGGALQEAISLTGLFIRKGPVVQTRDLGGHIEVGDDPDPSVLYDGPLIVLTSRFTASASEILAGALQDYGRALIVGDTSTFGKGTVQSIVPLGRVMEQIGLPHDADPGALKVTISKFYRPSGASTQLRGVASDIVLPSTTDLDEIGETALKGPLPWDVVPSASYQPLQRVHPYLDKLRQRSKQRVAAEKLFALLAGESARLKKTLAAKSVSLNEQERRTEQAADKARTAERDREARNALARAPKTYEVTLENVSSPELLPPAALRVSAAEKDATPDVILEECEKILADYSQLLAG